MEDKIQSKEKPQICAIDLDREIWEALKAKGLHCFNGTLDFQVIARKFADLNTYRFQLNWHFPGNLHEYDIVIVDLQNQGPFEHNEYIQYYSKNLFKNLSKNLLFYNVNNPLFYVSKYPETIFNPRPLSSRILSEKLKDFFAKKTLTIVFCSANETSIYYPTKWTQDKFSEDKPIKSSLYEFMQCLSANYIKNKVGEKVVVSDILYKDLSNFFHDKNIVVSDIYKSLNSFLQKYKKKFFYEIVFEHPIVWLEEFKNEKLEEGEYAPRKNFVPLLLNCSNEVVGFIDFSFQGSVVLAFPQLHDSKKEFLLELIDEILPGLFPEIFPYSEQFSWLKLENYFLPNQANIIARKTQAENEYKAALAQIEKDFQENREEYKFLHDLITETAEVLVKSVEIFFTWLGFENIVNMDETNPEIKEEDIQIILEGGLLVIEVKGIGGTSKDSECWQISKIKNRRAKERNSFDVFGLYIVNHQRYLPPIKRTNPPFTKNQIADAQSDERGLLTTYEIFNLYSYIENGFITKEDARNSLLTYGLVKFKPSKSTLLGSPLELYQNGQVVILNISNIPVNKSASIIVCHDEKWFRAEILEIRLDDETIESISEGQIGIKLSCSVHKKSELWLEDIK